MKKLLFSTICLGALCVGANADYYSGIEFGSITNKANEGESIGNMFSIGAYIRDYKESDENSSFVKSFRVGYDTKTKDNYGYTNVNAELLLGYGMYFSSDFSLNLLAGAGINLAEENYKPRNDSISVHTPYAKVGFSTLAKFGESKQFGVTLDAYFNRYLDYDIIEDRKENFFSAELGALYKFNSSKEGLYTKINVGTKDSLFSDKLNNTYFNIGLGYKF
ncbi:hypothetical protein AVANS_0308 [Campylobacter sp. RM5004]|uniref:hypothetical protein n=1 Tax=Campylobacter sp. RM5004 TaxID=1660078 RepID=UPI001EFBD783|nr:hypothetical protein [Campylobacter sp. RM5004]ULO00949.1 hypothetical protein AVANS_0308 [Campylobacter sp. RM5004]